MIWSTARHRPSFRRRGSGRRSSHAAVPRGEFVLEPRVLLSDVSVLQYRYDNSNTGQNLAETTLTPSNVNPSDFGKLYSYPVDGYVYAQPLYMANLAIPGEGTHNVVFVATEHDSVYALDGAGNVGSSGTPLWHDSFINPAAGITTLSSNDVGTGDIVPEVGITATPVVDQATGALYVLTKTKNVEGGTEHIVQELHALNVATGAELFGGPVVVADTTVNGGGSYTYNSGPSVSGNGDGNVNGVITFNALTQNDRPALVLNNGVIYLSYASHGDNGPYHGWVLGYGAANLQLTAVFNTSPNGGLSGIWGAGQGLAVDSQGNMYFVTGNGTFDTTLDPKTGFPASGDYGDSLVKIAVDPTSSPTNPNINGWGLKVLDYFTPSDQQGLNDSDADFGSGGPLLFPATATGPQVVLACGKEGSIFVVDTDTGKMGEFSPSSNNVYQELPFAIGGVWGAPGYFNGTVYYGPAGGRITAFQLQSNNMLTTSPTSYSPEGFGYPGPTPDISANGSAGGIVWGLDNTAYGSQGPAVLYAYDATNLGNEFYNSTDVASRDRAAGAVKFTAPTITNGRVYVGGEYALTIYGLVAPAAPSNLTAAGISTSQVSLIWQGNSTNESEFTIERSTDGVNFSPVATISANLNTYIDHGLTALTRYYYEVIASNPDSQSSPSNQASARTRRSPLPSGWSDADIGGPSIPGSASYRNGVYTVDASGNDISNQADQFHYVYSTMTGDGTIIARVVSQQNTDPGSKAGVMMRQSLAADSPNVLISTSPGNGTQFQWRPGQGDGTTSYGSSGISAGAPYWVKLTRTGSTFTGYASPDGANWTKVASVTIPMSTQIDVGLALSGHNNGVLNQSTFDNVSATQATAKGYIAIEAGGGPTGTFQADQDVTGGNTAQIADPINLSGVTNPAPLGVYQTERYGTFTYTIPKLQPVGLYTLRLHFSEDVDTFAGERVFNVSINGTQVLSNFDVLATTGSMFTAIVEQFAATADANGQLKIAFTPSSNSPDQNAVVNGIEIIPVQFNSRIVVQPASVSAVAGQAFSGTIATFVDTDPGGLARDYIATTNWGDRMVTTSTIQDDPSGSGYDVVDGHTYAKAGRYHISIIIQSYDGAGAHVIYKFVVVAAGPPPSGGPAAGTASIATVEAATLMGVNPFDRAPGFVRDRGSQ